MTSRTTHFVRGLSRLARFAIVVALVALAFNVIGYLSLRYDIIFLADASAYPQRETYLGRVLMLAFIGLIQTAVSACIAAGTGAILFLSYYAVLMLGGYRPDKETHADL